MYFVPEILPARCVDDFDAIDSLVVARTYTSAA